MALFIQDQGGEELIGWTEPSNYQQDKSSVTLNAGLFMIGLSIISIVVLLFTSLEQKDGFIIFAIFFGFFMTMVTSSYYFGNSKVSLEEEGIGQRAGKRAAYSAYNDIETCTVTRKEFPSASFFHLEFTFKNEMAFHLYQSVNDILLPNSVDLGSVLDILRSKGIKVVEDYAK
jgi:hypothetical protein